MPGRPCSMGGGRGVPPAPPWAPPTAPPQQPGDLQGPNPHSQVGFLSPGQAGSTGKRNLSRRCRGGQQIRRQSPGPGIPVLIAASISQPGNLMDSLSQLPKMAKPGMLGAGAGDGRQCPLPGWGWGLRCVPGEALG